MFAKSIRESTSKKNKKKLQNDWLITVKIPAWGVFRVNANRKMNHWMLKKLPFPSWCFQEGSPNSNCSSLKKKNMGMENASHSNGSNRSCPANISIFLRFFWLCVSLVRDFPSCRKKIEKNKNTKTKPSQTQTDSWQKKTQNSGSKLIWMLFPKKVDRLICLTLEYPSNSNLGKHEWKKITINVYIYIYIKDVSKRMWFKHS